MLARHQHTQKKELNLNTQTINYVILSNYYIIIVLTRTYLGFKTSHRSSENVVKEKSRERETEQRKEIKERKGIERNTGKRKPRKTVHNN